jgi:hypothetical protein
LAQSRGPARVREYQEFSWVRESSPASPCRERRGSGYVPMLRSNTLMTVRSLTATNGKQRVKMKPLAVGSKMIAGNCWGLISLSRLEGPANHSFRRFPLDFVSLKANRERKKGTRGLQSYESVLQSREQTCKATRNAAKQSSRRNLAHGHLPRSLVLSCLRHL